MKIFESLFDVIYLSVLVALGVRLLLEKSKGAKLFGVMAIVLGVGDGFHLLPRMISHLSPGGFEAHTSALSWGQFATSITMTIFYVLYYHYYRNQSNDTDNTKKWLIYGLAALRIVLVLLPQNNWGTANGNYMFGIYRNIPFLIMGLIGGVFYREFTKFYGFSDVTHLGKIHVHTLVLGFVVSLLLYLLAKDMNDVKSLKKPYAIYLTGLTFTIVNMVVIGIYEVVREGTDVIVRAAIDGTSGIGHIILGVGIVWMFVKLYNFRLKSNK